MGEIDLETILKVASDEKLATNAASFTDFLNSFDNIIKQLDKVVAFVNRVERSPALSTLIKISSKKVGVEVGPLTADNGGIIPTTNAHKPILESINQLNEQQLQELMQRLVRLEQQDSCQANTKKLEAAEVEKKDANLP